MQVSRSSAIVYASLTKTYLVKCTSKYAGQIMRNDTPHIKTSPFFLKKKVQGEIYCYKSITVVLKMGFQNPIHIKALHALYDRTHV